MTDGVPVSPETHLIVPTMDAWARLGDLGVSSSMQDELIVLWDRVQTSDVNRIKFAAGLLLLAESIEGTEPKEATSAVVIPMQERHEIVEVAATITDSPSLQEVAPVVEPEATVAPITAPVELVVPKPNKKALSESNSSPAARVESFMKHLLGDEYQQFPAGVSLQDATVFVEHIVDICTSIRTVGRPTTVPKEQRVTELTKYLEGLQDVAIAQLVGLPASRKTNISTYRNSIAHALEIRGYDNSRLANLLQSIIDSRVALQDEPQSAVIIPDTLESLDDQTLIETTTAICKEYWKDRDSASLIALLTEQSVTDESTAARLHIRALLASFAPLREDDTKMGRIEWDAINLVTGFRIQQNDKILPIRFVGPKLTVRHNRPVNGLEAVTDGIRSLVKAAAKDYDKGWYPNIGHASAQSPAVKATTVQSGERTNENTELYDAVARLFRGSGLSKTTIEMVVAHMTDEVQVPIEQKQLFAGLLVVRNKWQKALAHNRRHGGYEESPDIRSREVLLPQDITIMSYLLGNETNAVMPRPYRMLLKDKALLNRLKVEQSQLKARIKEIVQKADKLAR